MISRILKYRLNTINYWLYGKKPTLLLHSGLHGDEYEIIDCVKKAIKKYLNQLISFLFVPEVSPSAVAKKKRVNNNNVDINRGFIDDSKDQEVISNMKILKNYRFDFYFGFHEHPNLSDFYLYDTANLSGTPKLKNFIKEIKKAGIDLYNGIDDPDDPILKLKVVNGYVPLTKKNETSVKGTFPSWAFKKGIIKRAIDLEVPGKVSIQKKYQIIDLFFDNIILGNNK